MSHLYKILILVLLLIAPLCFAGEQIADFEEDSIPVLNEELRQINDKFERLTEQSRARAYPSASLQTISTATTTKVTLDAETFDTRNEFDSTTNYRFTAKTTGYYQVNAALQYTECVADKTYGIKIYKNGGVLISTDFHTSISSAVSAVISDVVYLEKNDYLEMYTWHNFGVDKTLYNDTELTFMSIHRLP